AAGLENGQVVVWDLQEEERCFTANVHSRGVNRLVFNGDGSQLASYGSGDRVCCCQIEGADPKPVSAPLPMAYDGSFIGLGWNGNTLWAIEHLSRSNRMMWRSHDRQRILARDTAWAIAAGSDDGLTAAGYNITNGLITVCRSSSAGEVLTTQTVNPNLHGQIPKTLQLTSQGDRLLVGTDNRVQLWQIADSRCLWQTTADRCNGDGCDLSGGKGIPVWHGQLLQRLGAIVPTDSTD
ncbi:hypothetical protein C7271_17240, partial [filamentous cyanobacterium CCP5]